MERYKKTSHPFTHNQIGGILNISIESTHRVLQERQLSTLRQLAVTSIDNTVEDAYNTTIRGNNFSHPWVILPRAYL